MSRSSTRLRGIDLERNPNFRRIGFARRKRKPFGHDANNRALLPVELNIASDNAEIASKGSLPEPVRNIGGQRRGGSIIGRRKDPSRERRDSEGLKHAAS